MIYFFCQLIYSTNKKFMKFLEQSIDTLGENRTLNDVQVNFQ